MKARMCVILHPGVYTVKKTLRLSEDEIYFIGLGFPVLKSALKQATIEVTGSQCVMSGLIVDAPLLSFNQEVMIDVRGKHAGIFDVFGRTNLMWESPPKAVKTGVMLKIGGPNAFVEDVWLWRGDHWSGPDLEDKSFGKEQWDPKNINPYGLYVTEAATGVTGLAIMA